MAYHLRREGDGAGDSGPMHMLLRRNPDTPLQLEIEVAYGRPRVGWCVRVGSPYGRSYAERDYWTTTPVVEIIEIIGEDEKKVRFRTSSGSIYEWRDG